MEQDKSDKKLLGSKKIIFSVLKNTDDQKKAVNVEDKIKIAPTGSHLIEANNSNSEPVMESKNVKINSKTVNDNSILANSNLSVNDKVIITIKDLNWNDKTTLTFEKIIWKYFDEKKEGSDVSNTNMTDTNFDDFISKKDFGFKLFFTDNPNVVFYNYDDVKNINLQYLEKKHRGKITQILIERFDKKETSMTNSKLKIDKFEKYRIYLKNLIDPNVKVSNPSINTEPWADLFFKEFPDSWDYFEHIAITHLSERYQFQDYMSYICLYLYDNLRKLKDTKSLDHLKNKIQESPHIAKDLNLFSGEMLRFYKLRQEKMQHSLSPAIMNLEWTDENALIEIFLSAFIHTKFQSVNEIDLSQHFIMSDNILTVLSAIKSNTSVHKLILNSNKIGEEGMWQLGRVLNYNKIAEVDLSINQLTDDAVKALLLGLTNRDELTKTVMNDYNVTSPLVKLNLSSNPALTFESGSYIAKIIEMSPNLKTLNLSRISLEDKGFVSIINSMIKFVKEKKLKLETLIIFQTKIGSEGIKLFADLLTLPDCSIKSLILSDNKLEFNSAVELFKAVGINENIEELSLLNCEIGNELAEEIHKMIQSNTSLKSLYLYNNRIDSPQIFKKILKIFKNKSCEPTEVLRNTCYSNTKNLFTDFETNNFSEDVCDRFFNITADHNLDTFYDLKEEKQENLQIIVKKEKDYESHNNNICKLNISSNEYKNSKNRKLKYLDLSKNKCKLNIDNEFIDIIEHLDLESLDISQNFDFNTTEESISKKFKEAITRIQDRTKIIY